MLRGCLSKISGRCESLCDRVSKGLTRFTELVVDNYYHNKEQWFGIVEPRGANPSARATVAAQEASSKLSPVVFGVPIGTAFGILLGFGMGAAHAKRMGYDPVQTDHTRSTFAKYTAMGVGLVGLAKPSMKLFSGITAVAQSIPEGAVEVFCLSDHFVSTFEKIEEILKTEQKNINAVCAAVGFFGGNYVFGPALEFFIKASPQAGTISYIDDLSGQQIGDDYGSGLGTLLGWFIGTRVRTSISFSGAFTVALLLHVKDLAVCLNPCRRESGNRYSLM